VSPAGTEVGPGPRVAQVITRLILGGAQETAILAAERLGVGPGPFPTVLLAGPETGAEGSLWEDAILRGVRSEIVPSLVRAVDPLRDLAALRWLVRRFRGGEGPRFALVHTHSSKAGILGREAARRAGVPYVVHTVHGWSFHEAQPAWVRSAYVRLERRAAGQTDRIVCVAGRDVEKGLAAGIGHERQYRVIRSGIELARYHPDRVRRAEVRGELGIPAEAVVVGAVTRLSAQKAPRDLAEILLATAEAHPGVMGLVVGDGPERAAFEARLAASPAGPRVLCTGLRHDADRYFSALDVFVLPSLWEGLPRTLPQAMTAGVPIVCSSVDGNAEAVRDGVEGFLVTPGDVGAAVAAVRRLVDDPELRRRMGEAGRFRAAEFDVERMTSQLGELYGELCGGGAGGR
jgi:glycosyltransferase involved in cell wall biosynthesis